MRRKDGYAKEISQRRTGIAGMLRRRTRSCGTSSCLSPKVFPVSLFTNAAGCRPGNLLHRSMTYPGFAKRHHPLDAECSYRYAGSGKDDGPPGTRCNRNRGSASKVLLARLRGRRCSTQFREPQNMLTSAPARITQIKTFLEKTFHFPLLSAIRSPGSPSTH